MNMEAQQEINRQINSSERLLWADCPKRGYVFRGSDIYITLFALLWISMPLVSFISALTGEHGSPHVSFFLLPFLIVGFYLLIGRHFHDAWRRSRTFYGLTDQRVIIMTGWFAVSVNSFPLKSLPDLQLKEKSDSSGNIVFGQSGNKWRTGMSGMYWPGANDNTSSSIEFVDNVRSVYNQILAAQQRD